MDKNAAYSVFSHLEQQARDENREKARALTRAKIRVEKNFGSYLKAAKTNEELHARLALVADDLNAAVAAACADEDYCGTATIANIVIAGYRVAEVVPTADLGKPCPTCKAPAGAPCKAIEDDDMGGVHPARKDGEGKAAVPTVNIAHQKEAINDATLIDGQWKTPDDTSVPESFEMNTPTTMADTADFQLTPDVGRLSDELARMLGVHPDAMYDAIMDLKNQLAPGDEDGGAEHYTRRQAADVDTGDSYVHEMEELPKADATGLADEATVPIDKAKSGDQNGWTLKPIDVPSNRNRLEEQSVHQVADYTKELEDYSGVKDQVDAGTPMQPEMINDQKTQVFPNKNQAQPVTSKWHVI